MFPRARNIVLTPASPLQQYITEGKATEAEMWEITHMVV